MSTNSYPPGFSDWRVAQTGTESRWQDLKRTGGYFLPIAFLLFWVIVYAAIWHTAIHIEEWIPTTFGAFTSYMFLFRIAIVALFPTAFGIAGLQYILRTARGLVAAIYQPDTDEKLSSIFRLRLLGIPPFPPPLNAILKYPFIVIREPKLKDSHWVRWFGGPATLVIFDGIALYLEYGNRFSRVVGPGAPMPFLERHEVVKELVDLRPQTKTGEIHPWTKDGIKITLEIRTECQIFASREAIEKSANLRYPFDPLAVKAAVEYTAVIEEDGKLREVPWLEGAWGTITGEISGFVAGHSLDELFLAPLVERFAEAGRHNNHTREKIEQILSRRISEHVLKEVQADLQNNGVRVLNIQITKIGVPEKVQELRTKYWESLKQRVSAQRNSRAEADRIRIRENAHAEAQRTMLMTITKKLESIDPENMTEPLILSLSGILDQGLDDPLIRPWIANESFAVLEKMRKLLDNRF